MLEKKLLVYTSIKHFMIICFRKKKLLYQALSFILGC